MRVIYDCGFADDVCPIAQAVRPLPGALEEQELRVFMDETEEIAYSFDELDEITHAYAVTVHRCQGSEYADGMCVRKCEVARAA
jgi:hypothetical protein